MAFELRSAESLRKGVRRLVRKQLDNVSEEMSSDHTGQRDEAVHEGRKSFKKIRAVLRLVRPAIGEKAYRAENNCFRDAGRPLTEVRDAKVLVETLDGLIEHYREHITGRAFADVREALQNNLRSVRRRVLDQKKAFGATAKVVGQARKHVKDWADAPNSWSSVGRGLEKTYGQACAAFEEAAGDPTTEKMHEWRKQAKYLRYQLELLHPLWPERLGELAEEADQMGTLLGDDHDLAVLRQMLTSHPDRFGDEGDREALLALIDRRHAELLREALQLGRRFFEDRPRRFARRLKAYWKTWRNPPPTPRSTESGA